MSPVSEHLERRFQSFINTEQPFAFFKGLAEYVAYVLSIPSLKKVVDAQIAERDARYAHITELEEKAVAEMRQAKEKLLAVVEKTGMDTGNMQRIGAGSGGNLIEELKDYESGIYHRTGRRSDILQHYLFEVASNIRAAGHENEIQEFVATSDEYEAYDHRMGGPTSYFVFGNDHGMFIFSQTWPDIYQTEAILKKERELKPWGDFEALLRFKDAYDAVSNGGDFTSILQEDTSKVLPLVTNDDKVAMAMMAEDLQIYMGDGSNTQRSRYSHLPTAIHELKVDTFKVHARMVHNRLMTTDITPAEVVSDRTPQPLSAADKKRLYILDRLKEEWDLAPKQNTRPIMLQAGVIVYEHPAGEGTIPQKRFSEWVHKCGIDYHQLDGILATFEQEGLIMNFETMDDSR